MLPEGFTFSGTSAAGICLDTASLRRCNYWVAEHCPMPNYLSSPTGRDIPSF